MTWAHTSWERKKAARLAEAAYQVTVLGGDPANRISATVVLALLCHAADCVDLLPGAAASVPANLLAAWSLACPAIWIGGWGDEAARLRRDRVLVQ